MHRLPRLKWLTWLRLALIRAGHDWRDLRGIPEVHLEHEPRRGVWRVTPWGETATAVTGTEGVGRSNGLSAVADVRVGGAKFNHAYRVSRWGETAGTVCGGTGPSSGGASVADPRLPDGTVLRANGYRIQRWESPSHTVTGAGACGPAGGAPVVADPRLGCEPRNGTYGVIAWDQTAPTAIGSLDVHAGTAAVADPRHSEGADYPVIVSLDGTWHRPLTTLELAALQGLPLQDEAGKWLELPGSDAKRRELIGNAVPPPAARAMAETILVTLLAGSAGTGFILGSTPVWVERNQEMAQ